MSLRAALAAIAIIAVAIRVDPRAVATISMFGLIYLPAYGIDRAIGPMRTNVFTIVVLIFVCLEGAVLGWIAGTYSGYR